MNSLYQQLNQVSQKNLNPAQATLPNHFKNFISFFKNASNPQQFLLNYIQKNPQAQNIYNLLQSSGKSPKELFY